MGSLTDQEMEVALQQTTISLSAIQKPTSTSNPNYYFSFSIKFDPQGPRKKGRIDEFGHIAVENIPSDTDTDRLAKAKKSLAYVLAVYAKKAAEEANKENE